MHGSEHVLIPLHIANYDISITPPVIWTFVASAILLSLLWLATRNIKIVPKNYLQNLLEITIEFVEKQILEPSDLKDPRYTPFILSMFLFILFNNLMGILPGASPSTGNINSTAVLAIFVFVVATFIRFKGKGALGYFKSLVPSGIKGPMMIIMIPLEFISQLVKPFSLAIRLFANMSAGHLILITFIGFTVLFKNIFVSTLSVAGTVLMSLFELFIGFIQAYIFAFLSALFISESLGEEN